jgi:hypothetical protein
VLSIVCNGGPIGVAERIANFCNLHALRPEEKRRLHLGFAMGRFEFMARPYGIFPRDAVEKAAWPALKGQIFLEASEIFLRLLRGDAFSSNDTYETVLRRENFRSDADWQQVKDVAIEHYGLAVDCTEIPIAKRYVFEDVKIIPQEWDRSLLSLVVGSHDPAAQQRNNLFMPTKVFNLSITSPAVIDKTHDNMKQWFHADGGAWQRNYMPRTVMVFLNNDADKTEEQKNAAALVHAKKALSAYWNALEGTLDTRKVDSATDNALVGSPSAIAQQILERFHQDDAVMLWFDFFNHHDAQVCSMMEDFMQYVVPIVEGARK